MYRYVPEWGPKKAVVRSEVTIVMAFESLKIKTIYLPFWMAHLLRLLCLGLGLYFGSDVVEYLQTGVAEYRYSSDANIEGDPIRFFIALAERATLALFMFAMCFYTIRVKKSE